MEDKELQELEEFSLEDIIREFSDHPMSVKEETAQETEPAAEEVPAEEVVSADAPAETEEDDVKTYVKMPALAEAAEEEPAEEIQKADFSDTVRLDTAEILRGTFQNAQPIVEEEVTEDTIRLNPDEVLRVKAEQETQKELTEQETAEEKPAFAGEWEPEYEQPMGTYVPPQPIAFPTRPDSREMKRKLVIGPEKRYYELAEKGLGKLQLGMFFCLIVVVLSAASTILYAQGMVPESRLRLMIFGQFMAVMVSALLGSFQLIQGVADLFKGRFTLNTLLVFTFFACAADGVFCLLQERIPCCAAFSLEVLLSLWSEYNRRHSEMGQMDVLRKAGRLNGIYAKKDAYEGKAVLMRMPGQVEHFMDNYNQVSAPEKRQSVYALIAFFFSIAIGVAAGLMHDLYTGIQITEVSLLAAVPATAFIAATRPFAILQRRLHKLGAVLCGWQGVKQLCGKVIFPLENEDIFPVGTTRMNGVKFFGERSRELVMAYVAAVMTAEGNSLAPLFRQVLDSHNGKHYEAEDLRHYDNGGIGGTVLDEAVLIGSLSFLKEMGVEVPEGIQVNQTVCVAIDGELSGIFAISYEKTRSATAGVSTLSSYRGLNPVMVSSDFMMSEKFIRGKFGIKSKRLQFPGELTRELLRTVPHDENPEAALLTTVSGLAPAAFAVTGARALRKACNFGVALHMAAGILGMLVVLALVVLGALHLLTPVNMFLYQLVWIIPGLLVTMWTKSI